MAGKGVDGLAALFGGIVIGGLFHAVLGLFIGKIRFALPPLVTGLVVTMIGLALVKVGIKRRIPTGPSFSKRISSDTSTRSPLAYCPLAETGA